MGSEKSQDSRRKECTNVITTVLLDEIYPPLGFFGKFGFFDMSFVYCIFFVN